jgi:hypothetical protein
MKKWYFIVNSRLLTVRAETESEAYLKVRSQVVCPSRG